jgi:hypothetical protein
MFVSRARSGAQVLKLKVKYILVINICNDCISSRFAVHFIQILVHPCDKMILERAFDDLMK